MSDEEELITIQDNNSNSINNNIKGVPTNNNIQNIKARSNFGLHRSLSTVSDDNSYHHQHQIQLNSSNSQFIQLNNLENLELVNNTTTTTTTTTTTSSKEQLQNQLLNSSTTIKNSPVVALTKDYLSQLSEDEATELTTKGIPIKSLKLNRTMSNVSALSSNTGISMVSFDQLDISDTDKLLLNFNKLTQEQQEQRLSPIKNINLNNPKSPESTPPSASNNNDIKQDTTSILNNINNFDESTEVSSNGSDNVDQITPNSLTPPINRITNSSSVTNNNNNNNQQQPRTNNKVFINGYWLDKTMPINFNVGGTLFATSLRTISLYPQSLLYKIVEIQIELILKDEVLFIDRSPSYFGTILDFIRTGQYVVTPNVNAKGILAESEFFKLEQLSNLIRDESELTRTEVVHIINTCYDFPRFRGMWLCKLNFSGLELSCAMFEYSNLTGCLFNSTLITKANLQGCKLDNSSFKFSKADNANFSKALITNSNFSNIIANEIISIGTNFSNSKLSNSILSCSDFTSSTFKGALLDGVDFTNCNLSDCDFRGSIIDERTNFSGSVLKGCLFDENSLLIATNKKSWKKPKSVRMRNKIISIPHV